MAMSWRRAQLHAAEPCVSENYRIVSQILFTACMLQVDAGIDDELVLGDPTAPRFVFWGGELLPTPSGPDVLTFKLLSLWGKLRAGLGAIGIKKPLPGADHVSSDLWLTRRLTKPSCAGLGAIGVKKPLPGAARSLSHQCAADRR